MGHGYCFDMLVLGQRQNGINCWMIYNKAGGLGLGEVKWYPTRRAYMFHSAGNVELNAATLLDLGRFCKLQTEAQLIRKRRAAG